MTLPLTKVLDDEWRLKEAEKPPPEPRRPPIAFGVNGPYLWEAASERTKGAGDDARSEEGEKPPLEPIPNWFGTDCSDLLKQAMGEQNESGESPSP